MPATIEARPASRVRRLLELAADALLPQRCLVCDRFGAALHARCVATLPRAEPPRCDRCWRPSRTPLCERCVDDGAPVPSFAGLRTPFRFEGDARRALLEAKFRGVTALLEPLASEAAAIVPTGWRADLVVPVPLHRRRQRRRGFNQAAIAAGHVARLLGLPLEGSLRRVVEREPQAQLDAEQRARNLEGVFEVGRGHAFVGRRVLLVDDVTTTGATLEAAATALREADVEAVYGLALARED